jgi:hypothetical protein
MKRKLGISVLLAALLIFGLTLIACGGGKKDSSGSSSVPSIKSTGKNYTLSKDSDFKYDLTKIDGQDYVVIKAINLPAGFKFPEGERNNRVIIDTITLNVPEKIEGYTVGVFRDSGFYEDASMVITSVTLPDSLIEIGNAVFSGTSITSIKLPKNLKKLGADAFRECKQLTSITIPDGVTIIEANTFWDCLSLKEVSLPDSITSIGGNAFAFCSELTTVKLPSKSIKYPERKGFSGSGQAFQGCSKLSLATRNAIKETGYDGDF